MRAKSTHKKRKKRRGCGIGSGHGKTSTRGHKGQRSRSGYSFRPGFEGGQNPIYRRLPKRGFNNKAFKKFYTVVNLKQLAGLGETEVTPELLVQRGVVKKLQDGLKVLGEGDLKGALTVKAHVFSNSAKTKIEAKGGQAVLIERQQIENPPQGTAD